MEATAEDVIAAAQEIYPERYFVLQWWPNPVPTFTKEHTSWELCVCYDIDRMENEKIFEAPTLALLLAAVKEGK